MSNRTRSMRLALATCLAAVCAPAVLAASAQAYGITDFSVTTSNTQAGGHPDLTADMSFTTKPDLRAPEQGQRLNVGNTRNVTVDVPAGITGNPENLPKCSEEVLNTEDCPADTQVGMLDAYVGSIPGFAIQGGAWLVEPRNSSETARIGIRIVGYTFFLIFDVRTDGDYGLRARVAGLPAEGYNPERLTLHLWGVPGDSSHDLDRFGRFGSRLNGDDPYPITGAKRSFLNNPTSCGSPGSSTLETNTYQEPDVPVRATSAPLPAITGCDLEAFDPSFTFRALTPLADSPSAFEAALAVPKQADPVGVETSHVRKLDVTLPEGVAISPPGADGLGACGDGDLKFATRDAATCPASARLGEAEVDVPILRTPLMGSVYLRPPTPGHLFRLAIVASGVGVNLKLLGEAVPDPATGRLHVVFDETPQQPVTAVKLRFSGGSRAPLATPQTCSSSATSGAVLGWSGLLQPVSDPFTIGAGPNGSACPNPQTFSPAVTAGSTGRAGGPGAFDFELTRPDGQPNLGALRVALPPGLVGRINTLTPCSGVAAASGSCPAASRIGTTTVGAGSGSSPLYVRGPVYLTRGYRGAPFGLSIVVPTAGQAGPFDLGNVVVRAGLAIDPRNAQVRVDADPLPQILQGVPLRLRDVRVAIDRSRFIVNPTDCSRKSVATRVFAASGGASVLRSTPFQVGECAALGYKPKLGLRLTGKGQTTDGKHPGLLAKLRPRASDANTKTARVTLPSGLALDPGNAQTLCEPAAAAANRCPKESIVGRASAVSILRSTLRGPVYFVRGTRRDRRTGRTIKTLPKLYIPLSGEGVRVDVRASSAVSGGRLVAAFGGLPDVPLKAFDLRLNGGGNGIIAVSGKSVCEGAKVADARLGAHNGRSLSEEVRLSRPCG